jgi:hypothetical protein
LPITSSLVVGLVVPMPTLPVLKIVICCVIEPPFKALLVPKIKSPY